MRLPPRTAEVLGELARFLALGLELVVTLRHLQDCLVRGVRALPQLTPRRVKLALRVRKLLTQILRIPACARATYEVLRKRHILRGELLESVLAAPEENHDAVAFRDGGSELVRLNMWLRGPGRRWYINALQALIQV